MDGLRRAGEGGLQERTWSGGAQAVAGTQSEARQKRQTTSQSALHCLLFGFAVHWVKFVGQKN